MRYWTLRALSVILCLLFLPSLADAGTIGWRFREKNAINVYIKDIVNESGNLLADPAFYKKSLEESLINRRSLNFVIVEDPSKSDIEISVVIKKFQYLERGPFKPTPGIGTTILDAAATATQNYVEMFALHTVTDSRTHKVLWEDVVDEYYKREMTPGESVPLIYDKISREFIWRCFGKANRRDLNRPDMI